MRLSMGIVGLPNAGKSTLFNALTKAGVLSASYPFATIDPNVGVVPVPDRRLPRLAEISGSAKTTPASVRFVDIAGLVKGASKGEGLGNRFLANIRDVTAICHVVRAFTAPAVAHVEDDIDPLRDIETVETEMALADLEVVERRLQRVEREATADPRLRDTVESLERAEEVLSAGKLVVDDSALANQGGLADLFLLTAKPVIYVFNADQELLDDKESMDELAGAVAPAVSVFLDADFEAELAKLGAEESSEMLESLGMDEPGLDKVVRAAFGALDLQTFLTTNPNETRAWTIPAGATAVEAAAEVHTDFARGFIAADVIACEKLVEAGSWQTARSQGQVRTEGRGYAMQPDDVVEFRFNL